MGDGGGFTVDGHSVAAAQQPCEVLLASSLHSLICGKVFLKSLPMQWERMEAVGCRACEGRLWSLISRFSPVLGHLGRLLNTLSLGFLFDE